MSKSAGVEDVVKWMKDRIKEQELRVEEARKDMRVYGHFEDCGPSYELRLERELASLSQMVSWKISTEKYMKKLRHEEAGK